MSSALSRHSGRGSGRRRGLRLTAAAAAVLALTGCASGASSLAGDDDRLRVVTTTGILRDLVANVGGDRVQVDSLVPDGGDPHTYEPAPRDVRNIAYADVAFTNYLLLEEHSIITSLDANLRPGTPNISLAEESVKYAAEIIPLVENENLDTVWLGMRVQGSGEADGATRASDILMSATALTGPGKLVSYLTGTFGDVDVYFDSGNGFDAGDGYRDDTAILPPDAHTHLSWAFTKPGVYHLTVQARLQATPEAKPVPLGSDTFTFAVGVSPYQAGIADPVVLDSGHSDITADLDTKKLLVLSDPTGGGEATQKPYDPSRVVIEVPNKAIDTVPAGPEYRFLGGAGQQVYQLPQAVLGKHVHGEIDPHLWQNVKNAESYVKLIRDTLIKADPDGATTYRDNAEKYLARLDDTDHYVAAKISEIPEARRLLVTTHDAFAYFAQAYGMKVAGFVTPNPATEPSLQDRLKLTQTIQNLRVPAVFLEPNLAQRASTLQEIAAENHIQLCTIYGDTFGGDVTSYIQMMRFNADSVEKCLNDEGTKETK